MVLLLPTGRAFKIVVMEMHLLRDLISTVCGRGDDEVPNTINRNEATCKTCLKHTTENYPNK